MPVNLIKTNQEILRTQREVALWEVAFNQLTTDSRDLSEELCEAIKSTIINALPNLGDDEKIRTFEELTNILLSLDDETRETYSPEEKAIIHVLNAIILALPPHRIGALGEFSRMFITMMTNHRNYMAQDAFNLLKSILSPQSIVGKKEIWKEVLLRLNEIKDYADHFHPKEYYANVYRLISCFALLLRNISSEDKEQFKREFNTFCSQAPSAFQRLVRDVTFKLTHVSQQKKVNSGDESATGAQITGSNETSIRYSDTGTSTFFPQKPQSSASHKRKREETDTGALPLTHKYTRSGKQYG